MLDAIVLLRQHEPKQAHKTLFATLRKDASFHGYLAKVFVEAAVADILACEKEFN